MIELNIFRVYEISIIFLAISSFVYVWTNKIELDPQLIPTILNGLTASISLIIAFTSTLVTFTFSKLIEKPYQHITRMFFTINFLVLTAALLWTTYANLMLGAYENAFRVSMTALALSIAILMDFFSFSVSELARRQKTKTTSNED